MTAPGISIHVCSDTRWPTTKERNTCKSIYAVSEDYTEQNAKRLGTACAVKKVTKTTTEYCILSWNGVGQNGAKEMIAERFSRQFSKRKEKHSVKIAINSEEEDLSFFQVKFRPDYYLNLIHRNLSQEELESVRAGFSAYTFMEREVIQLDFKLNYGKYDLVKVTPLPEQGGFDKTFAVGAPIIVELGSGMRDTVIGVLGMSTCGELIPHFLKVAGVDSHNWPSHERRQSSDSTASAIPSVKELNALAKEIPNIWESLGVNLNMDQAEIDNILRNHSEYPSPVKKAYQMLMVWHNRGQSSTYTQLSEALVRENRSDLARKYCEVVDGRRTPQVAESLLQRERYAPLFLKYSFLGKTVDPPLQKEIKNEYSQRHSWIHPFPWLEHFQLALNDVFTRLKIVVRDKERYVLSGKTVSLCEVFESHKHCECPKRVLIEADAGMGKTTFSEKLCLDWASGDIRQPFPFLSLVILLKCRDLVSHNIMEAMVDQLLPKDVSEDDKCALFRYIEKNQSDILLVVDGLDEVRENVDLSELIQRKILSHIHLLVTTRQDAGISIRQYFDSLFEITGYTFSDAKAYIRKYFELIGEQEKAEQLLRKVDETFNKDGKAKTKDAAYLEELLSNPTRTSLLCAISGDYNGELPASRTRLYTELCSCILRRHFKKEHPGEPLPDDPLLHYREDLTTLGKLALHAIEKNQLHFEAKELEGHSPNIAKFGFLSKEMAASKSKPILKYSFLYRTFQEFFSSFYLCEKLVSGKLKSKRLFQKHSVDILQFTQVFIFCAGILVEKGATDVLRSFVKHLTQTLRDCSVITAKELSDEFRQQVEDVRCSFLLLCGCVIEGNVGKDLNMPQKRLCAVIGQNISWEGLGLNGDIPGEMSDRWKVLCEVLKNNSKVMILHLNNNQLTDVSLLVNSLKHRSSLQLLYLHFNHITDLKGLDELRRRNKKLRIYGGEDEDNVKMLVNN